MEKKVKLERVMTEPEYRALPNISYSKLSALDRSPYSLVNNVFEETEPLIYGSAVDVLLFDGEEVFDKQFAVMTADKPTYFLDKLFKGVLEEIEIVKDPILDEEMSSNLEDYSDIILRVAKAVDYGQTWKPETVVRKVVEACQEAFEFNIKAKGKRLLSPEQYEYAVNSVNTLKSHQFTKHLFEEKEGVDRYFQFPIEWEVVVDKVTISMKSLLDILIVDHNKKTIEPKDLKTTGKHVLSFPQSFIEWRYYLQAASYSESVRYLINTKYPELKDYKILPFEFVVISSKDPMRPLMFIASNTDMEAGTHGGVVTTYGREVKGYIQLLKDMMWHTKNELYDYPREVYESKGMLTLNAFEK